jgi:hypothetical protein
MAVEHGYDEGLRDGRLQALEDRAKLHGQRLDNHDTRLTAQERIVYAFLGAFALIQVWPVLKEFLRA